MSPMQEIKILKSSVPMPLMSLPVYSPLVNLGEKQILISPGSRFPLEQYDPTWKITDIVAPNLFHHAGVPKAASVYPSAKLWAAPGLEKKIPHIKWTNFLSLEAWPYQSNLTLIPIQGSGVAGEHVFISKQSKTLIVTDLAFNIKNASGLGAKIMLSLFGTHNRFAVSRLLKLLLDDRLAFERSMHELMTHDFENILVSHGEVIIGNAKNLLREALKERGFRI